ncbi:hypothetical protein GO003_006345 [Methylicorpusculum oleiharenae]|uniref:hypothetical protein n=1 Tax=Methylicorpusculum oleiharenae TaxID=1338687 RepID=UPI00135B637E|nr:hypothetical protein [Methylicorpusculum oleiharenae]MCD2450004.1 hypothetical protein [Methylicorpusculum oleiharenae]
MTSEQNLLVHLIPAIPAGIAVLLKQLYIQEIVKVMAIIVISALSFGWQLVATVNTGALFK